MAIRTLLNTRPLEEEWIPFLWYYCIVPQLMLHQKYPLMPERPSENLDRDLSGFFFPLLSRMAYFLPYERALVHVISWNQVFPLPLPSPQEVLTPLPYVQKSPAELKWGKMNIWESSIRNPSWRWFLSARERWNSPSSPIRIIPYPFPK